MTDLVAAMDLAVACKVKAYGALCDVLDDEVLEELAEHLESGVVGGEDENSVAGQMPHA